MQSDCVGAAVGDLATVARSFKHAAGDRSSMLRLPVLVAAAAAAAVAAASPASACCHVYELDLAVGPCAVEWRGDAFHGYQDRVGASCAAGGQTVGVTVDEDLPPCAVWPEGAYCG